MGKKTEIAGFHGISLRRWWNSIKLAKFLFNEQGLQRIFLNHKKEEIKKTVQEGILLLNLQNVFNQTANIV